MFSKIEHKTMLNFRPLLSLTKAQNKRPSKFPIPVPDWIRILVSFLESQ